MTYRATGQFVRTFNAIIPAQLASECELIIRLRVAHVEDQLARPQVLLWRSMAAQAPLHEQRWNLVGERHAVDLAVTRRAADTLVHMNAVIEIHEARQVVDSVPAERATCRITGPHRLEHLAAYPNLRMAVHASFRGG